MSKNLESKSLADELRTCANPLAFVALIKSNFDVTARDMKIRTDSVDFIIYDRYSFTPTFLKHLFAFMEFNKYTMRKIGLAECFLDVNGEFEIGYYVAIVINKI